MLSLTMDSRAILTDSWKLSNSRRGRWRSSSLVWRTTTITATLTHLKIEVDWEQTKIILMHLVDRMMGPQRHSFISYRELILELWCQNTRKRKLEWWKRQELIGHFPLWIRRYQVQSIWWSRCPVLKRCIFSKRSVGKQLLGRWLPILMIPMHNLKRRGLSGWSIILARSHPWCLPVLIRIMVVLRAETRDRNRLEELRGHQLAIILKLTRIISTLLMRRLGQERSKRDHLLHFKMRPRI